MMLYADDLSLFAWYFQTKTKKEWWKTHACPPHQKQDSCELLQVSKTQAMSVFMHVTKKKNVHALLCSQTTDPSGGSRLEIFWFVAEPGTRQGRSLGPAQTRRSVIWCQPRTRQDHTKWWIKIHSEQNQSSLPGGPRAVFFSAKGRKPKTWFKYPTFSCVRIIKDLHHFQGYAYSKNTAVDCQCNMFSLATCQLGQWT